MLLTATGSTAASCPVLPNGGEAEWIDPETTVCSVQRCTDGDLNKCLASTGQMATMQARQQHGLGASSSVVLQGLAARWRGARHERSTYDFLAMRVLSAP